MLPKVILCGNSAVGKTCLSHAIANKDTSIMDGPTMGAGFTYTTLNFNNESIPVNIWDTAGQEKYKSMIRIYFCGCSIVLIVFDISSHSSFEQIDSWLQMTDENCRGSRPSAIIIANKSDVEESEKEVTIDEIEEISQRYGCDWVLTSAKEKTGIDILQNKIAEILYKKRTDKEYKTFHFPSEVQQQKEEEQQKVEKEEENVTQEETSKEEVKEIEKEEENVSQKEANKEEKKEEEVKEKIENDAQHKETEEKDEVKADTQNEPVIVNLNEEKKQGSGGCAC